MKQTGVISTYLIAAIAVLTLLLAGAGLALKKQIQVNGEQRATITEQANALEAADKQRKEAEKATAQRDADIVKITQTNRRLRDDITKATSGNACADQPIPDQLDRLLKQRAPKAGQGMPAGNRSAGASNPGMDG